MPEQLALLGVVTFTLGIAIGTVYAVPLPVVGLILLLGTVVLGAWSTTRRRTYLTLAIVLLTLAAGVGRGVFAPQSMPSGLAPRIGTDVEFTGMIAADPDVRESSQRLTIEGMVGGVRITVLAVTERYPERAYGDTVIVRGKLMHPEPFDTDGGRVFAYDRFLAKDGIVALIPRAKVEKIGTSRSVPVSLQRLLFAGKHRFEAALAAALPEPHASLADGIIAGGKQGLGTTLLAAFTATGLLPIIVLSGANVMIIAEAVLAALRRLPPRGAALLAGGTVVLFVLAAGGGASALRAALMALLALYARATRRTYQVVRALLFVFVLMLLISPLLLLYDPGFQFSFAATLGLVLLSEPIGTRLEWITNSMLREVLATTLAAQLMVLPLLLYQTGNLSLVAVPANLLVLPVIPAAMAASAIAAGVALMAPPLATYAGLPAYLLLSYVIKVAEWFGALPFADVTLPAFSWLLLVPAYAGIAWLVRVLRRAPGQSGPR